jgi:hypothetical protein
MPITALAYRPFDGTDASVASYGDLELELGPVGYLRTSRQQFLVAPATILNVGVMPNWELVLQGNNQFLLGQASGDPRYQLVNTGLFLKGILREGSLQGKDGLSVATEVGPLLPTVNSERGTGMSAVVIVSQRWPWGTIHLNSEAELTRTHNLDLFGGAIIEGPYDWTVRPVAEMFYEKDFSIGSTFSGLLGAIWRVNEGLSFDLGLRGARVDQENLFEVRAGFTWATPLWH